MKPPEPLTPPLEPLPERIKRIMETQAEIKRLTQKNIKDSYARQGITVH